VVDRRLKLLVNLCACANVIDVYPHVRHV